PLAPDLAGDSDSEDEDEKADVFPVTIAGAGGTTTSSGPAGGILRGVNSTTGIPQPTVGARAAFRTSKSQSFCMPGTLKSQEELLSGANKNGKLKKSKDDSHRLSQDHQPLEPAFFANLKQEIQRKRSISGASTGVLLGSAAGGLLQNIAPQM
ncbi:unnamed protein product, partial [Amoebophrya sp. A25]